MGKFSIVQLSYVMRILRQILLQVHNHNHLKDLNMDIDADDGSSNINKSAADSPFDNDPNADIVLLTIDKIHFFTHKLLLSLVSPVFQTMFSLPSDSTQETYDGRSCVAVADDSQRVFHFLSWCDPRCTDRSTQVADLVLVLEMADKYGADVVIKHVENFLLVSVEVVKANPLLIFAISARFRCNKVALLAARHAVAIPLQNWPLLSELEHISALTFQKLVLYQKKCVDEARGAALFFDWVDRDNDPGIIFTEACIYCVGSESCLTSSRGGLEWLTLWLDYMDSVASALKDRHSGSTAEDEEVLGPALQAFGQSECSDCRKIGPTYMVAFAKVLAKEVDARIAQVRQNSPHTVLHLLTMSKLTG